MNRRQSVFLVAEALIHDNMHHLCTLIPNAGVDPDAETWDELEKNCATRLHHLTRHGYYSVLINY